MVPPKHEEVLGVLNLVAEEEADCFEGLFTAVNVVAEEDVVGCAGVGNILGWG